MSKELLEVGKIAPVKSLKFRPAGRRSSRYDSVFGQMEKLKAGESFTVPTSKEVDIQTLHNRMNAAIRRGPVKPPEGCVFRKRTTADGDIAVCCLLKKEAGAQESGKVSGKEIKAAIKKAKAKRIRSPKKGK